MKQIHMVYAYLQPHEQEEYIYNIPTRGVVHVQYEDVANDTNRLITLLTSLILPFDAHGLLEMFEFLYDRPYVLYQYPTIREAIHDVIRALRPILNDRYNENGLVQQSVMMQTTYLMNQCHQIETLMNAVEGL